MPEEWPGQSELHGHLKKLDGISSSKIAVIAKFAVQAVKYYKFVVFAVEHHMKHGDGKARLQGMCIIDAILRAATDEIPRDRNPYPSRFSKNMAFTLGLAAACTDNDRGKIVRIVKIWVSAKLLPEHARREINDWLEKNESSAEAGAIREPTSRLLSSIDKLKEGPSPPAAPVEDPDMFDYGDEDDDDEARLASQARRLEEQSRKLEAEKEAAAANAVKSDARPSTAMEAGPSVAIASNPTSDESELHRFGFVRHPDQSNVPTGMVRVLSCVLYIGGIPSGFQADQLRSQIGSFGKIDDIRIVNGAVANSAFVRYIDREEAESAKNLIRSYCPEYKIGWGKGVGVTKEDFDTRQGIGMVPEASLARNSTPKPSQPSRPGLAESHTFQQAGQTPAAPATVHGSSMTAAAPNQPWHQPASQHQPQAASSWNGISASSSMRPPHSTMPSSYGGGAAATPPRSIGAVPAAWDGGVGSTSFSSPTNPPPPSFSSTQQQQQQGRRSGWGSPVNTAAGGGWNDPGPGRGSAAPADSRSNTQQRPSWESAAPLPDRTAPAADYRNDLRGQRPGGPIRDLSRSASRGSFDNARDSRTSSSSFDHSGPRDRRGGFSDLGAGNPRTSRGPPSSSREPGPAPRGEAPFVGRSTAAARDGSWDGGSKPSSGPAWGEITSSGASWGDLTSAKPSPGAGPSSSWVDTDLSGSRGPISSASGSSWSDLSSSGRTKHSSSGASWDDTGPSGGRDGPPGRNGGGGSSWGDSEPSWSGSSSSRRGSDSEPRSGGGGGGGGRFNDRNEGGGRGCGRSSDFSRPWNKSRDDQNDFDSGSSSRSASCHRDDGFRGGGPPRHNDRDDDFRSGQSGGGGDFRGGRGGRVRGGGRGGGRGGRGGGRSTSDNGSWGNGTSWGGSGANSGIGDWASATKHDQSSSSGAAVTSTWNDQPSVGASWGDAPSTGPSWGSKPAAGAGIGSGAGPVIGWDTKPSDTGSSGTSQTDANFANHLSSSFSMKRGRSDDSTNDGGDGGGWGSLPPVDSTKKSRDDGW